MNIKSTFIICILFSSSSLFCKDKAFSIAAVADVQYADTGPRGGREPREGVRRLRHAISHWNQRSLDWGVILGDIIDWDDIDYSVFPKQTIGQKESKWKHAKAVLAAWQTLACPRYLVLGNHDYYVPYRDADGTPKPASVLRAFGFEKTAYYDFFHKGFRFVVLDGDMSPYNYDPSTPEYQEAQDYFDSIQGPQKTPWNAGISKKQLGWLTKVLDAALASGEPVVIMCHYPIHNPSHAHSLLNSAELLSILKQYPNVVLWLNGHNHAGDYALMGTRHHLNLKGMQNEDDNWYQLDFSPTKITVFQAEDLTTPKYELDIAWRPGLH